MRQGRQRAVIEILCVYRTPDKIATLRYCGTRLMPSSTTRTSTPGKRAAHARAVKKDADIVAPKPRLVTPASEIDGLTGDPNFMTSLARGLAVIRAFTQQRRHLTIAQLSHRTGIPRAAVRRCLYTLAKLGYVVADEARGYSLRPRIL